MKITILLFATLKDLAGRGRLTLTLENPAATIADVRSRLGTEFPHMQKHVAAAIAARNQEYALPGDPVADGDEIAFFPPVSGGSGENAGFPEIFELAPQPVSMDALMARITIPATGAICVFGGVVRGETQRDHEVAQTERLEYEAYEAMALAKMHQVAAEIREQFPLVQGIAIVQRIGTLRVGENTIVIACASGHRDQGCFEAARYGIDRLKEIVPVWKKEIRPDGSAWVEGAYFPGADDIRSR
jgi:molybdopterin synthase catalytic subunit